MIGHFERLIRAGLQNPDLPLAKLAMMDAQERELVLVKVESDRQPTIPETTRGRVFTSCSNSS